MAMAGRIRSSVPRLTKALMSDSVSTQRLNVERALICPNFTDPQVVSRNFASASSTKEPKIKEILGKGKKVKLEQKIDPSILGGLVVEFGQKVFDMSIKTRAKQMERFLRDPINFDA
ncbi:unnamed protein product [Lactuca virosa]|uniref:ATP synthase subunit O, mitochondrial n=1 Tax=Lactuca virosa TaxID=75947 RepID=A0AAU9NP62_9ASTR|nr:unnamed protein product [Lactuca virosa]